MSRPTSSYCYGFRVQADNWPVSRPIVAMRLRWYKVDFGEVENYPYDISPNFVAPENQVAGPNRWEWSDEFNAWVIPGTGGAVNEAFLFCLTWNTGEEPAWFTNGGHPYIETAPGADTIFDFDYIRGESTTSYDYPVSFRIWSTEVTRGSGRKWLLQDTVSTSSFDEAYEVLQEVVPGQTVNEVIFLPVPEET